MPGKARVSAFAAANLKLALGGPGNIMLKCSAEHEPQAPIWLGGTCLRILWVALREPRRGIA